jgi:hypothetical protein
MFMPPPIRRSPMQSFLCDMREIGRVLRYLLITPALWPHALHLLCKALILLGKTWATECRLIWHSWRLGMTRVQVRSNRENPWRPDTSEPAQSAD